jgi:hypothetical protein
MTDKPPMAIARTEAEAALAEAQRSERRSLSLHAYRFNAPLLMLWGAIWIAVYLVAANVPGTAPWTWAVAGPVGGVLSSLYVWRNGRPQRREPNRAQFWRVVATWALNVAFVAFAFGILSPFEWRQPHAFIALALGACYAVAGCWMGWRLIPIGYALTAISMIAYFSVPPSDFFLVLYIGCGSVLIAGGLWLRFVR